MGEMGGQNMILHTGEGGVSDNLNIDVVIDEHPLIVFYFILL